MQLNNSIKTLCVFAGSVLLSACEPTNELVLQPDGNGAAALGMTPPSFLADPRVVDQSLLVLDITANNISVPMEPTELEGEIVWQGNISFEPNTQVNLVAAWSEAGSTLLPLARASHSFILIDDPDREPVRIEEIQFNTNFDSDNDERSNIAELRANSDPRNNSSPGTLLESLPVRINFGVPASLQSAGDAVINALSLTAIVNGEVFIVTRNGNIWSGQTTEFAGNDVFIEANFFSNSSRLELLDRYELRSALGANGLFIGLDTEMPTP